MRRRSIAIVIAAVIGHGLLCIAPLLLIPGGVAAFMDPAVLLLLLLLSAWVMREAAAQPGGVVCARRPQRPDALPLAMLLTVWAALTERTIAGPWLAPSAAPAVAATGAAMVATGAALRVAAIRTLGVRFLDDVDLLPWHELARNGPYRLLRHPAETGNVLIALGCGLLLGSVAGVMVAAAIVAPLAVRRARREDVLLAHLRTRPNHPDGLPAP